MQAKTPAEAMKAPREKILYTVALYIGTGIQKPDYLATIDADPQKALDLVARLGTTSPNCAAPVAVASIVL